MPPQTLETYLRSSDQSQQQKTAAPVSSHSPGTLNITKSPKLAFVLAGALGAGLAGATDADASRHVPPPPFSLDRLGKIVDDPLFKHRAPYDPGWGLFAEELLKRGFDVQKKNSIDAEAIAPVLVDLIGHESIWVRREAMKAVSDLKIPKAIPGLQKLLRGQTWEERCNAAKTLASISLVDQGALKALSDSLDDEEIQRPVIRGMQNAWRAKGPLAEELNGKLKKLYDEHDWSETNQLSIAMALLQTGTAHQDLMVRHVYGASNKNDKRVYGPAANFFLKDIHNNPDPNVSKFLLDKHRGALANKKVDDWNATNTAFGLTCMESVSSMPDIAGYLWRLRGEKAAQLSQRIFKSYDLIENGLPQIQPLAEGHPDQRVRVILLRGVEGTFRGPHLHTWVAERLQIEKKMAPKVVMPE